MCMKVCLQFMLLGLVVITNIVLEHTLFITFWFWEFSSVFLRFIIYLQIDICFVLCYHHFIGAQSCGYLVFYSVTCHMPNSYMLQINCFVQSLYFFDGYYFCRLCSLINDFMCIGIYLILSIHSLASVEKLLANLLTTSGFFISHPTFSQEDLHRR